MRQSADRYRQRSGLSECVIHCASELRVEQSHVDEHKCDRAEQCWYDALRGGA